MRWKKHLEGKLYLWTAPAKLLGEKGVVSINATQWGDDWCSVGHSKRIWTDVGENWNAKKISWQDGTISVGTGASNLTDDSNDLDFLYIKNKGASNNCLVSLNGTSGNYYIIIPPKGSISLRGDGTSLDCNDVYVKTPSGGTSIEYVIAKE